MNRTPYISIFLAVTLCLSGSFVSFAADPVPPASVQKTSATVVKSEPAPMPPAVKEVAAPAVKTASSKDPADDTISLDFKDAEIGSVLRVLSMKSNVNIVTGPEVTGLVTVRLDNVPWEKALDVILRTYDYVFERDGNIIRVTSRDKMKLEPVETKTFILNYSKASEIQASIQDILTERGKVKVAERTNMVVVTDIPANLYKVGEVIKKLDKMTSQAFIDSKIIKTDSSKTENLGIKWNPTMGVTGSSRPITFPFTAKDKGTPTSLTQFFPAVATSDAVNPNNPSAFPNPEIKTNSPAFSYGTLNFSTFSATLEMLKSFSNTKVVSNPRVVVLNNQTAHIQVGKDYPIPSYERNETTGGMVVSGYDYRQLGVVLNVTPHINSAEEILVDLKPEISDFGENVEFIADQLYAPSFTVTKAETQVLIQSGQTIAIGGLMTDAFQMSEDKVPYMADIPLVGKLFRSKRQTPGSNAKIETLFFVTVTTVDSQGQPVGGTVDGKNDQSQEDQAKQKTAATDAGKSLKDSGKITVSESTNKDKKV